MKKSMTPEEAKAIASLKRALTKCKKLRIVFVGMDDTLHFVTKRGMDFYRQKPDHLRYSYGDAANAYHIDQYEEDGENSGDVVSGNPYIDSGGW